MNFSLFYPIRCFKPLYYPDNHERSRVLAGFYEHGIWYSSDSARNQTRNMFCLKRVPIPLGHSRRIGEWFPSDSRVTSSDSQLRIGITAELI